MSIIELFFQVKVTSQSWNSKYRSLFYKTTDFQVHDEENYCVVGDKVVISRVKKFTPTKYYYVRNIVKAFPREDFYKVESPLEDKDTLKEFEKYKKDIFLSELGRSPIMSRKQVAELKKNAKAKAILKINDYIRKKEKAKSA